MNRPLFFAIGFSPLAADRLRQRAPRRFHPGNH